MHWLRFKMFVCATGLLVISPARLLQHGGYMISVVYFLTISIRPIIFARFTWLVELCLHMISQKLVLFFDPSRDFATTTEVCWLYPQN